MLFCLVLLLNGKGVDLGAAAIAVTVHELGHKLLAKQRGFVLTGLSLMPYGAVMYAEDGLPDKDGWMIALAGPAVNFFLSLFISALWWFFPLLYPLTKELFFANISIGVFNLLPCYPLDGSRILLCLTAKKKLLLKLMKGFGFLLGIASAALFIVSLFYTLSIQLLFLSVMFFVGATSDIKNETYRVLLSENYFFNDLSIPVEEKTVYVRSDVKIRKLLSSLDGKNLYRIKVVKDGQELALLKGKPLEEMFYADGDTTIEQYLSQRQIKNTER